MKQWFTTFGTSKSHGLHKSIPKKSKILDTVYTVIAFLNLDDFCMIQKNWTYHAASLFFELLFNCSSLSFISLWPIWVLYRRWRSAAKLPPATPQPPPSETQESVATLPCRIQMFLFLFLKRLNYTCHGQNSKQGKITWVRSRKRFHTLCQKHCKTNQNDKAPQQKM